MREQLEQRGFIPCQLLGMKLVVSPPQGDGASDVVISVGNYPLNSLAVCVSVGGYGIVTNANRIEDIDALIRLFDNAHVDHPDEEWIDAAYFDEE
jgi:hypothetical protein